VPIEEYVTYRALRGETARQREVIWQRPDGTHVHLSASAAPLRDADGNVVAAISVFDDITARKRAERDQERYLREIEALNAHLNRAMAETHHRVKNNLQTIAALLDMQRMTDGEAVPIAELDRLVRHVHGLAAIHDLLTQKARASGAADVLGTQEVLDKLMPLLSSMAAGRELRFHVEELGLSLRQTTGIAMLVNELVSNAVKHGQGAIDLTLAVVADHGRLQVRDHGPGFPAETAAGTGLDLVRSVCGWDLQGEVEFGNAPDGGACVTVLFPVEAA
jgi:two-component sensor histidine kinase